MKNKNVEEHIRLEIVERNGFEQVYGPPPEKADEKLSQQNLQGDKWNFFLLTVLYLLQAIPVQLAMAMPVILQSRGVSSRDQGIFSFATYPWSMKILWAPLVDLIYWKKLGRRKSWIVPTQYLLGIMTLITSLNIDDWIGDGSKAKPHNILMLTVTFFMSNALSAIQDVAVDGWSLTLLKHTQKFMMRMVRTLLIQHWEILNHYTLAWSIVYFATTTLILIFKKEDDFEITEEKFDIRN